MVLQKGDGMILLFFLMLSFSANVLGDSLTILENLCETLHIHHKVAQAASDYVAFPYLQMPHGYRFIVPQSSAPQYPDGVVPKIANQVYTPCLQQRAGQWPDGEIGVMNPHTGHNITFADLKGGAERANCGWHALKNALCFLNVRFRPGADKGKYLEWMQSPQAYVKLLKPWLEVVLPYRRLHSPGEDPLGAWPGEGEIDLALGRVAGVGGYDAEFAAIEKALDDYVWADGVVLRDYVSIVSQFESSFLRPDKSKQSYVDVMKKVCLHDDADHAFVMNTSANSTADAPGRSHWITFFLHKKNGVITWFSSDSLAMGTYSGLKTTLNQVFTRTPEQIAEFEHAVMYGAMIENASKLIGDMEQLQPANQYVFKGLLIKDVALGLGSFFTKEDLVTLGFSDSVAGISDQLLKQQMDNIVAGLFTQFLTTPRSMVFASFHNPETDDWYILREAQSKPTDMKLSFLKVAHEKPSQAPTQQQVAIALAKEKAPEDKRDEFEEKYLADPDSVDVPLELYWRLNFSNWPLAIVLDRDDNMIERFYNPNLVIIDLFEKLWRFGYDPRFVEGDNLSMKDKKVWPMVVRKNVLKTMEMFVDYIGARKESWPLTKAITIVDIPDTRGVAEVDQHDEELHGDVTKPLSWWLLETLKKTMPSQEAQKAQFDAMVAKLRGLDGDFADQVNALWAVAT